MKVETGKPQADGRYVCFIRCAPSQVRDWLEPVIMVWHGGRWQSTFMPQTNVEGWCGPIPVMKVTDIAPTSFPEEFERIAKLPKTPDYDL